MRPKRAGLAKVLEHRRRDQRHRQIAVGKAEARLARALRCERAGQQQLRDSVTDLGCGANDGASLRIAGRYVTHLRRCLQDEQWRVSAARAQLRRARERLVTGAREQAAIERLLASRRREREADEARADRAMHDEHGAQAARLRTALRPENADGRPAE